jgi:signal transduction histidine kinase/CheY-like chemotaxis protein
MSEINIKKIFKYIIEIASLAALYFITAKFGLNLASVNPSASPVWIPTGIAISMLILFGFRLLPGIFLGAFFANITTAGSLMTCLAIAAGNTLEGYIAAYLINNFAGGRKVLEQPFNIFKFTFISALAASASASIGVLSLFLGGLVEGSAAPLVWFTWWLGNVGGAVIIVPLIISLFTIPWTFFSRTRTIELVLAGVTLVLMSLMVFYNFSPLTVNYPIAFMMVPVIVWIGLRFNQRQMAFAVMVMSAIAIYGTLNGPFALKNNPNTSLLILGAFIIVVSTTGLLITAVVIKLRLADKALKLSNERLKSASFAKDQFLATLGHELRNPLAPALNSIELIEASSDPKDPIFSDSIKILKRQIKNMASLIDDLLDVSRLEQGTIVLRKEVKDIRSIINNAVETVRPLIDANKNILKIVVPEAPLYLDADPLRIEQVVINLLNNATKYTESGTEISLDCFCEDGTICIKVKDNGRGIDPQIIPQLFDFSKTSIRSMLPEHETGKGLGVGLRLIKKIIELHGGDISAYSAGRDLGSEFTVKLTEVKIGPDVMELKVEPSGATIDHQKKILVVDDNKDAAVSLSRLLEKMGNKVRVSYDGLSALTELKKYHPDMVLLDIGMPDMDGYEVAKKIRTDSNGSIKLVAVTGYGQEEDKIKSKESGFDHHITKPVEIAVLRNLLSQ